MKNVIIPQGETALDSLFLNICQHVVLVKTELRVTHSRVDSLSEVRMINEPIFLQVARSGLNGESTPSEERALEGPANMALIVLELTYRDMALR